MNIVMYLPKLLKQICGFLRIKALADVFASDNLCESWRFSNHVGGYVGNAVCLQMLESCPCKTTRQFFLKSRSDVEDVDDCSFSIEGASRGVEQNINRNVDDFFGGLWPNKQILDVERFVLKNMRAQEV